MELVHAIHFDEQGRIALDPKCSAVNLVFYDCVLDELTLNVYRDTAFHAHLALISLYELAEYTDLSFCAQHYVEISAGRWITSKDAVEFLKPWIAQVRFYYPMSILAHWYTPSPNNAQKALFFTFSLNNGETNYECIEVDVSSGFGSIEQSCRWRNRSNKQSVA